jgi:hypothetical protein
MGLTLPAIYIAVSLIVVIWAFVCLVKENKKKYQ